MISKIKRVLRKLARIPNRPDQTQKPDGDDERVSIWSISKRIQKTFFFAIGLGTILTVAISTTPLLEKYDIQLPEMVNVAIADLKQVLEHFTKIWIGVVAITVLLTNISSITGGAMLLTIGMVYEFLDQRIGPTAMRRRREARIKAEGESIGFAKGIAHERERQERERQRTETDA